MPLLRAFINGGNGWGNRLLLCPVLTHEGHKWLWWDNSLRKERWYGATSHVYICHVCAGDLMQLGRARPVSSLQGLSRLKPMSIHNNNELGLRAEWMMFVSDISDPATLMCTDILVCMYVYGWLSVNVGDVVSSTGSVTLPSHPAKRWMSSSWVQSPALHYVVWVTHFTSNNLNKEESCKHKYS